VADKYLTKVSLAWCPFELFLQKKIRIFQCEKSRDKSTLQNEDIFSYFATDAFSRRFTRDDWETTRASGG
jgi:hypothetical protein